MDDNEASAPYFWDRCERDDEDAAVNVEQEVEEKLSVVEANTVVDPWAMVVHVEDAAITNAAMMRAIWFPHVAHLAIPSPFCLVTHIEAPIRRDDPWIRHDALVESGAQIDEEEMVDEEHD
jgi:hypothetical protein